jgi:uncharacterized membrane protein
MSTPSQGTHEGSVLETLRRLEERIARIEEHLELNPLTREDSSSEENETRSIPAGKDEDELEFEVGQNWFAKAGIVVIAIGIVFLLTFPYTGLPAAAPGLFGYVLAGGLFVIAHLWRNSFDTISRYLRGAGMALLFFTTLRLFFFGAEPALDIASVGGMFLLVVVLAINTAVALRRKSAYLFNLALATGFATAVSIGTTWFMLTLIALLCVLAVYARLRYEWPSVLLCGTGLSYLTYSIWMINNPFRGNTLAFVTSPPESIYILLGYAIILAMGTHLRPDREREGFTASSSSFINIGGGYGLFLLHTLTSFQSTVAPAHIIASTLLLGLAIAFWVSEQSRYSTFAYAMLGYMALSVAISNLFAVPSVFVWLSVQSILVVATAVWFRSRFIVVANFILYILIVAGYVVVAREETGISLGFGFVALASARILNWQQDRLELKTEIMRNAYLASAFVVFPCALYHLVPSGFVSLAWVGIALFYYMMNMIIKAQKYRWMGHLTLLLTVLYVLVIGIVQLEPTYRILSFLVLGTALLVVSLVFTRLRMRERKDEQDER